MMSVPAPASNQAVNAPVAAWETGAESSVINNDTAWLLSFIDILTLLLTLFVLLLAYEHNERPIDEMSLRAPEQQVQVGAVLAPMIETLETGYPLAVPLTITDWFTLLDPRTMTRAASIEALAGTAAETGPLPLPEAAVPEATPAVAPPVIEPAMDALTADSAAVLPLAVETLEEPIVTSSPLPGLDPVAMSPLPEPDSTPVDAVAVLLPVASHTTAIDLPTASAPSHEAATAEALLSDISDTLRDRIEVSVATGVINLEISDNILFQLASAALTEPGYAALDELAQALKDQPYVLSVEGHTDNVPIQTALFPSNWELSAARAAIVTRGLIERGVEADRIRAIGYGDTHPRSDNLSAEGRARNRRVSFVLHVE